MKMEAVGGVFGDFVGASNSISSSFVAPLPLTFQEQQSAIRAVEAEKIPLVGDMEHGSDSACGVGQLSRPSRLLDPTAALKAIKAARSDGRHENTAELIDSKRAGMKMSWDDSKRNVVVVFVLAKICNESSQLLADIQNVKPTHVFNAAGVTGRPNVDWCESHKTETIRANVAGTLNLADVCREYGLLMINFATRCIFEYDAAHPKGSGIGYKEEANDAAAAAVADLDDADGGDDLQSEVAETKVKGEEVCVGVRRVVKARLPPAGR
ncbi:unnamed protein product [Camellia sinensis]